MDLKKYLIIIFLIFILLGIISHFYQNKPHRIGGKIAPSKNVWLMYTLNSWFIAPLIIYIAPMSAITYPLLFLALSMWIRGIIELYLLFGIKRWKPIYGIIHDLATFFGLLILSIMQKQFEKHELILIISLHISLLLETYYAYFFSKFIGAKTQGEKGIWFANKEDPLFKKILTITTIGNIYVISSYLWYVAKLN